MRSVTATCWVTAMLMVLKLNALAPDNFIDLSSRNLSSVPKDLPPTAEFVDLSCNHIWRLQRGDFKNTPDLRILNISWNSLEEIHPETFIDTPLLSNLDLSHNRLENLLVQRYLVHTKNLVVLNLAYNKFTSMTLANEFSSLVKLERLALGGKSISVGDFKNIGVRLRMLTLCFKADLVYETGSLNNVCSQRLQIEFNDKINFDLITDALSFFTELEFLSLTAGYKDLTKQLSKRAEIYTSHLYLTNILIKWPDFTEYVNTVMQTSITHLSFSDVSMCDLPQTETPVAQISKLKSFSVRRAVVKSFIFSQEAVYNFFMNMPVQTLAFVETSIIHMTCPKSESPITELNFSNCSLSDSIFSRVEDLKILECKNLVNVRKLILTGNNLKSLKLLSMRLQYMKSLQHVDLSLNILDYDGLEECIWPQNIINMTLSFNGLSDSVFKCLPKQIERLDLQNNQVSAVPLSIQKLKKLSSLNLSGNRLRDLPVCDSFPLLNELLLKSNSLHAPSVKKLESCPKLKTLDVSTNPFTCTCALKSFIRLGIKSEKGYAGIKLLHWPLAYHCIYPEADRDSTLKNIWIPEVLCSTGLLAAAILCPAVSVIIVVLMLCHRFDVPWYLRMTWQWTRAKHRARRQVRPEDLVGLEFHAFVSYSQRDADWVHNCLLPKLEGPAGGLRICHHEKNFVPGKTIINNIMTCVEKSRRCVFVLSAHFIKSEWCHYELYFASHERLAQGSESIVLVLLEPLPQYLIPSKYYQLKSMMGRHTYLEWPQDKAKQRLFWANLRAALQADLPHAPVTEVQG